MSRGCEIHPSATGDSHPRDGAFRVPIVGDQAASSIDHLPPEMQQRLAELLERCLSELEQGRAPDVELLAADQPGLVEPLKVCLDGLNFLHAHRGRIRLGQPADGRAGRHREETTWRLRDPPRDRPRRDGRGL